MGIDSNNNNSIDDVQVNVRFNEKDYQKLQGKFKKHIAKGQGKVPTIQQWIRECMLT